jgi:ribosome-binding protein aMBF1 (putative translation factor)
MDGYTPVWQTWDLVTQTYVAPCTASITTTTCANTSYETDHTDEDTTKRETFDIRQTVQRTRIEKRLSIPALSLMIRCVPETLAAFERGDDVLDRDTHRRLMQALEL